METDAELFVSSSHIRSCGNNESDIRQNVYPILAANRPDPMSELGIYGAVYKISIVMLMFTQAFRFAYEPFIFAKNKEKNTGDNKQADADAMKYFIIFGLLIFLGVMFYIDLVQFFMPAQYYVGIDVVTIVMM